jgi:cyclopropane-fatty-acyl-phospholipid synthase
MIEAVGRRQLPRYFRAIHDRLKPGARAALQVITVPDAGRGGYARSADFIQRHVFPGGYLPAPAELSTTMARAGLVGGGSTSLAQSYSRTLRCWHARFDAAWDRIAAQGFDARFRRVWETYLTACAAAFAHGAVDVVQMTARRPA